MEVVRKVSPLSCSQTVEVLGEYVDGDLNTHSRSKVEEHLSHCRKCRDLLKDYRNVVGLANNLGERSVPAEVKNRLRDGLNKRLGINLPFFE